MYEDNDKGHSVHASSSLSSSRSSWWQKRHWPLLSAQPINRKMWRVSADIFFCVRSNQLVPKHLPNRESNDNSLPHSASNDKFALSIIYFGKLGYCRQGQNAVPKNVFNSPRFLLLDFDSLSLSPSLSCIFLTVFFSDAFVANSSTAPGPAILALNPIAWAVQICVKPFRSSRCNILHTSNIYSTSYTIHD